jgi:hypothetical protein
MSNKIIQKEKLRGSNLFLFTRSGWGLGKRSKPLESGSPFLIST